MSGGMLVFWGVVAWVVVQVVRDDREKTLRPTSDPEAILAARYARGEIDADEYAERLDVLRNPHGRRAA
jgi:putative membrane protein